MLAHSLWALFSVILKILGGFRKIVKASINFVMSVSLAFGTFVCVSVGPHGTGPLEGFS